MSVAQEDVELEEYVHSPEIEVIKKNKEELRKCLQPPTRFIVELNCLSKKDEKQIKQLEKSDGLSHAAEQLLNILINKKGFWQDLLDALEEDGKSDFAASLRKDYETIIANEEVVERDAEEAGVDDGKDDKYVDDDILNKLLDDYLAESPKCSSPTSANKGSEGVQGAVADTRNDEVLMDVTSDATSQPQCPNHLVNNDGNSRPKADCKNDLSADYSRPKADTSDLSADDNSETDEAVPPLKKRARLEAPLQGGNGHATAAAQQHDSQVDALIQSVKKIRIRPESFEPRSYQSELAERAKDGINCVICAPTGSGKTFVALMIAENHIFKGLPVTELDIETEKVVEREARKCRRVLFVVPTLVLVQQTYKILRKHQPTWYVMRKSSRHNANSQLSTIFQMSKEVVVVITAGSAAESLQRRDISIRDISLLLFDECHKAKKESDYCKILNHYLRAKEQSPANLPQVVGFTASPDCGKKEDLARVKAKLLWHCARMAAEELVTVRENLGELEEKIQKPSMTRHFTVGRPADTPFIQELQGIAATVQKQYLKRHTTEEAGTVQYRSWLDCLEKEAMENQDNPCIRYCKHLQVYNKAILRTYEARMVDGYKLLENYYSEASEEPTDKQMLQLFEANKARLIELLKQEAAYPNPKLEKVVEAIENNLKNVTSTPFKGMVLVQEVDLALALAEYLGEKLGEKFAHLKPAAITGEAGMTQHQVDEIVEQFRTGERGLLVATSVAEMGLDIPECRLMINYEYCRGVVSLIQSRGRVRARHGSQVVIGGLQTQSRLHDNLRLELVLTEAMVRVQRMQKCEFQQAIKEKQEDILREVKAKEQEMANRKQTHSSCDVIIHCATCRLKLCQGSELKRYHEHVIVTASGFPHLCEFRENANARAKQHGLGRKLYCKGEGGCDSQLATEYEGKHYCIKAKAVGMEINGKWEKIRQWKNIPFEIDTLE